MHSYMCFYILFYIHLSIHICKILYIPHCMSPYKMPYIHQRIHCIHLCFQDFQRVQLQVHLLEQ